MQMINTFWQELQESWEQIKEFYKKTKVLRWFGACLMFVLYGIRFVQGEYFVDSELMLTAPEELLQSWYGHRRFALIFTRKLFGMLPSGTGTAETRNSMQDMVCFYYCFFRRHVL